MWAIREGKVRGKGRYLDEGLYLLAPFHDHESWVQKQTVWDSCRYYMIDEVLQKMGGRRVWVISKEEKKIRQRLFQQGWKAGMTKARDFARECEHDYEHDFGRNDLWAGASFIADNLSDFLAKKPLLPAKEAPIRSMWERLDDA